MSIDALITLAFAYPGVAVAAIVVLVMLVILAVLIARERPLTHQAAADHDDDSEDYNWLDTTGRAPLDAPARQAKPAWGRSGGNWWPLP